jgi:hypothetical protein
LAYCNLTSSRFDEFIGSFVHGLVTDAQGRPVAVSMNEDDTQGQTSFIKQLKRTREILKCEHLIVIGKRRVLKEKVIDNLRKISGVDWITTLGDKSILKLTQLGQIPMEHFGESGFMETVAALYPGERLGVYYDSDLSDTIGYEREDLLDRAEEKLQALSDQIGAGKLLGKDKIGLKVGAVLNKLKVEKYFDIVIEDALLSFVRKQDYAIAQAAGDGLYVIRTSTDENFMSTKSYINAYDSLGSTKSALRAIKLIEPEAGFFERELVDTMRSYAFLGMLAYYVEWHMRGAWRELYFVDDIGDEVEQIADTEAENAFSDELFADDFPRLLDQLATVMRVDCRIPGSVTKDANSARTFEHTTVTTQLQRRALELVTQIKPSPSKSEPSNSEPSSSEPNSSEPSSTEPSSVEPNSSEPNSTEPSSAEPNSSEPNSSEPSSSEPSSSEPSSTEPSSTEPNSSEFC